MNNTMINKQKHGGLQLKNVLETFQISSEKVCKDLNITMQELVSIFSKQELDQTTIQLFSNYLSVPSHVITNFKDDMNFNTTILSENNTVINYNYCINQNSIENIAKIYEVVKELIKKENGVK
ncbi:hypothetical protein M472_20630 [Sphingobacterium paucimobilis HER1398]|uniref:Uncharacterized protein n=2 Tax=Sphingobacterium TaxID=28453 RepID=U2HHD8_9SPHI|nr:hypothetical protein M472_20630 [Sphingobacterium paucimobilis HER1398]